MDGFLFLDVDGVLNPWLGSNLHGDWRKAPLDPQEPRKQRFWVSAELGRWLADLDAGGVRIVWATTWVRHPAELASYARNLGVPDFADRIDGDLSDVTLGSGKLGPIRRWLSQHQVDIDGSRIVWVDDALGPHEIAWARSINALPVRPNPAAGLADRKLRTLIEAKLLAGQ